MILVYGRSGDEELVFVPVIESFFWGGGAHLRHMEDPRLGVESKLQLPHYATAIATANAGSEPHLQPTPTAHSNTGSLIHQARLGIKTATSQVPDGFVSAVPQQELQD